MPSCVRLNWTVAHDASATYRGYRRQALYVLARILTDNDTDHRVYRPEGAEDLAIYTIDQRLVEVVQVKDHSSPLTVSDFKPASPDGYFARLLLRRHREPQCINTLATFGALGLELSGAIIGNGPDRAAVVEKLSLANPSTPKQDAALMLDALRTSVTHLDEPQLRESVVQSLQGTIAGGHTDSAIELLLFWIFDASERRRDLTRSMLVLQLERIGVYLAALRNSSAEWMTTVRPLQAVDVPVEDRRRLIREYRQGVQATWSHILADADHPRVSRLADIHNQMQHHSVVVVRGASGQGKSSLGWRYLRDYCAEGLRFHVRLVEGREHALRVANALRTHVQMLRLEAVIYLDVAPSDSGWPELLRELAEAGVKVLVTIREEDFQRGGLSSGDIDIGEVNLDSVSRVEAEAIFAALAAEQSGTHALDFDEAWARFSALDAGPLLEFTYLITQGDTLASRVEGQIRRIQREAVSREGPITTAHLRFLALAAVANAADCRVDLDRLCELAGLEPLTRPLDYLENEYLIRVRRTSGTATVAPLHPLRSKVILAALLHDAPESWGALASQCLPLVIDDDLERFLLSAFSQHPHHATLLEGELKSQPLRSWTRAGGICRALLWEGVDRYERENRDLIVSAIAKYDSGWWFVCDSFIAAGEEAREALAELIPGLERIELTPKDRVFSPLENWAAAVQPPVAELSEPADWIGAGDVAFWLGHCCIESALRSSTEALLPDVIPSDLSLTAIGSFVSGRSALGDAAFSSWHDHHAHDIADRFVRETGSIYLHDDGTEVKVFFPAVLGDTSHEAADGNDLHGEALRRIRLMRQLFPQRSTFSSQGLGLEALGELMPHDPTTKQIPAANLHPARAVQVNGLFGNLVQYRHQRANSWRSYADSAVAFREAVCTGFRQLHRAWGRMLEERQISARTLRQLPGAALDQIKTLSKMPMLPRTAVDEWGFVSEGRERSDGVDSQSQQLFDSAQRFKPWLKSFGDFEMGVSQVIARAVEETAAHLAAKKDGELPSEDRNGHLLLVNLEQSWTVLSAMQKQFRRLFGHLFSDADLDRLESYERSTVRHFWATSFAFVREPLRQISGGAAFLERRVEARREQFLRSLEREIGSTIGTNGEVKVHHSASLIESESCLLVVCDHQDIGALQQAKPAIVEAIWRAAQDGGWQSLEWVPHAVEWPNVFVVHTFRGRALMAGGARISSLVLFGTESGFQAAPHHLIDVPVPHKDFQTAGVLIWELPIIRAAVTWQAALIAFALTAMRFYPILEVMAEHAVTEDVISESLRSFSRELTTLREAARQSYEDLATLLESVAEVISPRKVDAQDWLGTVRKLSDQVLFSGEGEVEVSIDPSTFAAWISGLAPALAETNEMAATLVVHAVTAAN